MNAPVKIKPERSLDELRALRAEREAKITAQIAEIAESAAHLVAMRKLNLKPMNRHLLWAEWHFAKAQHELLSNDDTETQFQDACHALGIDEEGEAA
jgi:hypothetical protein